MLVPRMNGTPPYLIVKKDNRHGVIEMLNFSLNTKSPLLMSYTNMQGETSAKMIIVQNFVSNNLFHAQVVADKKEDGSENTNQETKQFKVQSVNTVQVPRYPAQWF